MAASKSKKYRLSSVQREILWALEESGAENIPTVLNTLRLKCANLSPNELLSQSEKAIRGLKEIGFISLTQDYEKPGLGFVPISPEHVGRFLSIGDIVTWDEHKGWTWDEIKGGVYRVSLALTEAGRTALNK